MFNDAWGILCRMIGSGDSRDAGRGKNQQIGKHQKEIFAVAEKLVEHYSFVPVCGKVLSADTGSKALCVIFL